MTALAEYLQMTWLMSLYLVELLAELEGDDGVVPGVEDEDGEVDVVDEVVGAEGDVALVEGPREEPLEPRHLPPQVRHRVHADLRVFKNKERVVRSPYRIHDNYYLNLPLMWHIHLGFISSLPGHI